MISGDHKKHPPLARPSIGNFSRNEWAIIGAECALIQNLSASIIGGLSDRYNCAYVDTNHRAYEANPPLPAYLKAGASLQCSFEGNHHQFFNADNLDSFRMRKEFANVDLVLVNGNHHNARAQVVVISEKKKKSLQNKLALLTDVQLFILDEEENEPYDFLKDFIPNWNFVPVLRINDTTGIIAFFSEKLKAARPVLNGLVLAGGKSMRMGFPKGSIQWHGKEQQYYLADLLKKHCAGVYISCRPEQEKEIDSSYKILKDTFTDLGPYGAILSAFRSDPDKAWLVLACDLPLIDDRTIQHLVQNRESKWMATSFESPTDHLPEPLIAIWEPKSYPTLLWFLSMGYSCPRKVLRNNPIHLLQAPDPQSLRNVNTYDEYEITSAMIDRNTK